MHISLQGFEQGFSDNQLCKIIENELNTSLSCVNYHQMTENLCLKYGVNVAKEDFHMALTSVDPDKVNKRKSKTIVCREYLSSGPGGIYHRDGNDKLKRWGVCIHECVDRFSQKLLWLIVASSNNGPIVISQYFLRCIKKYGIAPNLLRMDKGRENIYCEDLQLIFTGREDSYPYTASTRNQHFEA